MKVRSRWIVGLVLAGMLAGGHAGASTLEAVKKRGNVRCGVNGQLPGFSLRDAQGKFSGLDVDVCRAVAAAVLGDADRVEFMPQETSKRFEALRAGKVDLVAHNATWTLERDFGNGLNFVAVDYYDGQGFLVRRSRGLRSALELDQSKVCVQKGSTSEMNLEDYFMVHRMRYRAVPCNSPGEAVEAYEAGRCDVMTSDQSQLYALRTTLKEPEASQVLPEVISKEPLGPYVREGDDAWMDVVRWSLLIMINAEEMGVSSGNVDRVRAGARNPDIRRLLGLEGYVGARLGLREDWCYQIIKQVGNYDEVFRRNVGADSPLKILRGLNALWRDGGILYAPPVR